jgi:hypothetical protein
MQLIWISYSWYCWTTTVTSANDGGLESNGDLASLIANRNFNRIKQIVLSIKRGAKKVYS